MKIELLRLDFYKTRSLMDSHNYQGVIDGLAGREPAYDNQGDSQRAAYAYTMGIAHSKIGDYEKADMYFDRALGMVPSLQKIKLERIDSLLRRGNIREAQSSLEETFVATKKNAGPHSPRLYGLIGTCLKLLGDYEGARASYEFASDLDPENGNHKKGIQLMDDFIKASETAYDRTQGISEYANHLFHQDLRGGSNSQLSLTFLKNCLKEINGVSDRVNCYAALAQHSAGLQRFPEAIEHNQKALDLDNNHTRSLALRIRLMFETGNWGEAMHCYEKDKNIISRDPRASLNLARTFIYAGKFDIAHDIANEVATKFRNTGTEIESAARIIRAEARQKRNFNTPHLTY